MILKSTFEWRFSLKMDFNFIALDVRMVTKLTDKYLGRSKGNSMEYFNGNGNYNIGQYFYTKKKKKKKKKISVLHNRKTMKLLVSYSTAL